jgi:hypothetical protein
MSALKTPFALKIFRFAGMNTLRNYPRYPHGFLSGGGWQGNGQKSALRWEMDHASRKGAETQRKKGFGFPDFLKEILAREWDGKGMGWQGNGMAREWVGGIW